MVIFMDLNFDLDLGINVVFCGVAIVFLMLLILIGVMYIFGAFSKTGRKQKTAPAATEQKPAVKAAPAPIVADGVDDETVAAITAAIYYLYGGSNVVPAITFIQPSKGRPVWAKAGIAQNTKAF